MTCQGEVRHAGVTEEAPGPPGVVTLWHSIRRMTCDTDEQLEDRINVESPSIEENVV